MSAATFKPVRCALCNVPVAWTLEPASEPANTCYCNLCMQNMHELSVHLGCTHPVPEVRKLHQHGEFAVSIGNRERFRSALAAIARVMLT